MQPVLLALGAYPLALVLFVARAVVWFVRRALSLPAYNYLLTLGIMWFFHEPVLRLPLFVVESFVLGQVATFVFDVIHWTLHAFHRSRLRPLRLIGGLHDVHHRFLKTDLQFDEAQRRANNLFHVLPEFGTRIAVCVAALLVLPATPVVRVVFLELVSLALFFKNGGNDGNHVAHPTVRAAVPSYFVDTWYHSLHHIYPDGYFSSIHTTFDRLFGTGCVMHARRALIVDAGGPAARDVEAAFRAELAGEGAVTATRSVLASDIDDADLAAADILVICQDGASRDKDAAFIALLERFRALKVTERFPCEVWGIARSSDNRPRAGSFAAVARRYYADPSFIYRHVVVSGAIGSEAAMRRAARWAFFLIRRGFRYVPATGDGIALLQYFRFERLRVAA